MGSGQMSLTKEQKELLSEKESLSERESERAKKEGLTEGRQGHSECDSVNLRQQSGMILEKEMELVARENHRVEVIKMLKRMKVQEVAEMPELEQSKQEGEVQNELLAEIKTQQTQPQSKQKQQHCKSQDTNFEVITFSQESERPSKNVLVASSQIGQQSKQICPKSEKQIETDVTDISKQASEVAFQEETNFKQPQICNPQPIRFRQFSPTLKGPTIQLSGSNSLSIQNGLYYQNQKLVLTAPINSAQSCATFKIQNLKYCTGVGLALLQIIQKHSFNYKSYSNQLSHGLYIVTSQGYSWSHHLKEEDDQLRLGYNKVRNGDVIRVDYERGQLSFALREHQFVLEVPVEIAEKYTLCFCAYLHEKGDSVSLVA